jgi:hypothetical protein
MHHSHKYISYFVNTVFNQLEINYEPSFVYDFITLLKETNDIHKNRHLYEILTDNVANEMYAAYNKREIPEQITFIKRLPKSEENKIKLSEQLYHYVKTQIAVKSPPTAEELNISSLIN